MKRDDYKSEPLDAVLRHGATLAPGPATPECADPEMLAAYYDRSLAQPDRDRLEAHFADCARCQMQLAAIARAEAGSSARPHPVVSWLRPRWRVAVPALAAAAVLVVVVRAMRSSVNDEFKRGDQIAMAKHEAPLTDLAARAPAPVPPPAASAPAAPASSLAMNEAEPPAPELHHQEIRERSKPLAKAKPLPKSAPQAKAELAEAPSAAPSRPELETGTLGSYSGAVAGSATSAPGAEALVTITPVQPAEGSAEASNSSPRVGAASSAAGAIGAATAPAAGARALAMNSSPPSGAAWMVGKHGLILWRGRDGTTRQQASGVDADLTGGAAPDEWVCWVVGRRGTIVRTIDGENWTKIASPTEADLTAVAADSADHAIVTTVAGRNFETSDGGTTWHPE